MKPLSKEILEWAYADDSYSSKDVEQSKVIAQPTLFDTLKKPQYNDKPKNQMEVVQKLLVTNMQNGVCHSEFMRHYIARFGALIWILRHEFNWVIDKEWCDIEEHGHKTNQYKYILKGERNA